MALRTVGKGPAYPATVLETWVRAKEKKKGKAHVRFRYQGPDGEKTDTNTISGKLLGRLPNGHRTTAYTYRFLGRTHAVISEAADRARTDGLIQLIVGCLVGAEMVLLGTFVFLRTVRTRSLMAMGRATVGQLTGVSQGVARRGRSRRTMLKLTYRYETNMGVEERSVRISSVVAMRVRLDPKAGDSVYVVYDPNRPKRSHIVGMVPMMSA